MIRVSNTRPGVLEIEAPQDEIAAMVRNVKATAPDVVVNEPRLHCCGQPAGQCNCHARSSRPSYLGRAAGGRVRTHNGRKPEPMPTTDWQAIFNEDAGKSKQQS